MLALEPHHDCAHPSSDGGGRRQIELAEYVAHVRLSSALINNQPICDGDVRVSLCHERQHLSLALPEPVESAGLARSLNQPADHVRIEGAAA